MFKYLLFACFLAFAAARPGALVSTPIVSTYAAAPLATYSAGAPLTYSAIQTAPVAYSTYGVVKPYSYVY